MIEGVDFSWGRPGGAALKAAGKKFVVRYVPYPGNGGKGITRAEIADYTKHGLGIAMVYESTANRALQGRAAGIMDARASEAALKSVGLPRLPIYFAVDFDANATHQPKIDDYLRGAASIIGSARVGVYAGYNVIQRCKVNRTATWFWQTYAWSGGRIASGIHLYQYHNGQKINGAAVDFCRAYKTVYGQVSLTPPPTTTDPPPVTPPKPPATDPYGNPHLPGSFEYIVWMHEHGYKMADGKWVKEPVVVPPPPVVPPPVAKPVFPALPTRIESVSSPYAWFDYTPMVLGVNQGCRIGSSGTAFVLVHGGPQPVGRWGDLVALGQRLAGEGMQAFCIDYRALAQTGEADWRLAVSDITTAVIDIRRLLGSEKIVLTAHSYGGYPSSIACFRDNVADAYAAINAISSVSGVGGVIPTPLPDPVLLAANRPTMPVAVIRGDRDFIASADGKSDFAAAVARAGHPGYHTVDGSEHTSTLFMDQTTDTLVALAKLL